MTEKRTPDLERCFRLYRIEGKPGKEVAEIMGTNMPNVSRWSQRFEQRFPERARKMIHDAQLAAGMRVTVSGDRVLNARSAFLERVRDEIDDLQNEPTIPGFEADDADDGEADDPPADEAPVDALTFTRRLLANTQRRGDRALRAGDHITAQRCGRDAASLVTVLARLERNAQDGADTLHISRADIEKTWKEVMAKVRTICSRPLVCEHCGKKMLVAFASDPGKDDDAEVKK